MQTVYIEKDDGYLLPTTRTFILSFEDKPTAPIDVSSSAEAVKGYLEDLDTILTVNVQKYTHNNQNAWIVTFTHLVDENKQGTGEVGILELYRHLLVNQR